MPGSDVFAAAAASRAFSMRSLMARLLDAAHIPQRLGELNLFTARPIATLKASVEKKGNTLTLVQTTPRGGPGVQNVKDGRELVDIPTARIALDDTISADEVQDVRQFGSEDMLKPFQAEVDERIVRMSNSIEATLEHMRMGAMKGQVLDADGAVLLNLFTAFGVSAQTEVDFDLDNATPASGVLRKLCAGQERKIRTELGGLPYRNIMGITSPEFFDDLIAHPEVRETVKNFPAALSLRESGVGAGGNSQPVMQLQFGGITWEEYRGSVGGTLYVSASKAHLFPVGVPELFLTAYAPAEYFDTVNRRGLPRYVRPNPENQDNDSRKTFRVQSHPMSICTRPRTLIPARRT